jgi:hypothetical protein
MKRGGVGVRAYPYSLPIPIQKLLTPNGRESNKERTAGSAPLHR